MKQFRKWWLCVFVIFGIASGVTSAQDEWMPDLNLRQAVRVALELPDDTPLTQLVMNQLIGLDAADSQITDLTGLEHAINLTWLSLGGNEIRNLRPLAGLNQLETLYLWVNPISDISPLANLIQLRDLDLGGCEISDIMPLATLIQLRHLNLRYNSIKDITPLKNLTELLELRLNDNRIADVSPLANLTMLKDLWITNNNITDPSPLYGLVLRHLEYDQNCELGSMSITERIQNRTFPSIFAAWGGIGWSPVLNLPGLSDIEHITLHDLYFSSLMFTGELVETNSGIKVVGNLEAAQQEREAFLRLNPNMLFLAELRMRDAFPDKYYHEDYPYWLRNEAGERVEGWPGAFLLDFTDPGQQDIIVQQALAVAQCGLYDGIILDWWSEDSVVLADESNAAWGTDETSGYRGYKAEQEARDNILQGIRSQVRNDFLILVNGNRRKMPRTGWAINGTFMETLRDHDRGYTHDGLAEIESTLLWAEENLREPRINCLEGWGIPTESPDSLSNLRWMRVFTTMGLTHSDGYVLYNDGIQHQHYWYDFWDADLGQPVGEKAQRYENRDGLFIREFTNGWAIYNRSGSAQEIRLPEQATGVESGLRNTIHTILDLDGEIYLKSTTNRYDINGDGTVNILDLVVVASGLGTDAPDVNGDGVVNILDLVAVVNAF